MKKYILIALFSVFGYMANAQITMKSSAYTSNSLDTVTNAGTKYLVNVSPDILSGKFANVNVFVTVLEISGTTGGTVSLEISADGTNWASAYGGLDSAYTHTPADQAAAQTFVFQLKNVNHKYYRVKYVGTGTMSASFSAKIVASKQ